MASAATECAKLSRPTASKTTSTPRPPVSSRSWSSRLLAPGVTTCAAPAARARATLSGEEVAPITVAPQRGAELHQHPADAAGRREDEHRLAGGERVDLVGQEPGGHALQEARGGGAVVDLRRQGDGEIGAHGANPGIGAGRRAGVGDAVAGTDVRDAGAGVDDLAGRLHAGDAGGRDQREVAGAAVDVDEVDADRGLAQAHLAASGRFGEGLAEGQNLRAAVAVDEDGGATQGRAAAEGRGRRRCGGARRWRTAAMPAS